jgi:uncharacterized phiE125 gp8 family phage protein
MTIRLEPKRAGEARNYKHDWSRFLGAEDTLASQTTTSSDVTISGGVIDDDNTSVIWKVSGGTDGTIALITQTIVTTEGLTETEFFALRIGADEPVSLADAKRQCRMENDDSEDAFIDDLISSARAYCERVSTHIFVPRVVTETFRRWGNYLELSKQPIAATDADPIVINYTDTSGATAGYTGFFHSDGRIYPGVGTSFPGIAAGGSITVSYPAGYAEGSDDEAVLIGRRAMLLLIGHWFEFREAAMAGIVSNEIALAVSSLLDSIRPISAY